MPKFFRIHVQGLLVALVFLIGVSAAIAGTLQLRSSIYSPFAIAGASDTSVNGTDPNAFPSKNKDTDGDGLSDYDEVNIYHTSPYLADTDGDGIPDGQEIKNGTDPNCPEGKTCAASLSTPNTTNTNVPPISLPTSLTNPSPTDLRNALIQSGMPADQVNALSDAQVTAMYQAAVGQSLNPAAGSASPSASANTPPSTSATAQTSSQQAAEIRQQLLQHGVTADQLKNVTDEQLLQTYQQSVSQLQSQQPANTNTP